MHGIGTGRGRTWGLVLAGGSGSRLSAVTTGSDGREVPKQYWSLCGGRSLLGDALERAAFVARPERTVVVVAAEHREHWRRELADHPRENVLVQPTNRGTAAGLLLPLLSILRQDPAAVVAVLPSDHFVAHEELLASSLDAALSRAARGDVVLLGIEPDAPETQYGWILPRTPGTTSRVRAFVEKPPQPLASELFERGALWNSFLFAACAATLVERMRRRQPELVAAFEDAFRDPRPANLAALYADLPSLDFSRDVLQGDEQGLLLRRVPRCGWTDLGTPERVLECLRALGSSSSAQTAGPVPVLARALRERPTAALA